MGTIVRAWRHGRTIHFILRDDAGKERRLYTREGSALYRWLEERMPERQPAAPGL